jgi:hypothetical protein
MRTPLLLLGILGLMLVACSSSDSDNTSANNCKTICDCVCGTDSSCLSQCGADCPTHSVACQECSLNLGCSSLKGIQGHPSQCSAECQ